MNELEALYGPVGLGLIVMILPYLLELWKMVTKWDGDKMIISSVIFSYGLVDLLLLALAYQSNPNPNFSDIIFIVLGLLLYPVPVWFGTQGVYVKMPGLRGRQNGG